MNAGKAAQPSAEDWSQDLQDYRCAPSGQGPFAAGWEDKPHRLIYDLCGIVHAERETNRELLEALEKFGKHKSKCGTRSRPNYGGPYICDCGLNAAIAKARK